MQFWKTENSDLGKFQVFLWCKVNIFVEEREKERETNNKRINKKNIYFKTRIIIFFYI